MKEGIGFISAAPLHSTAVELIKSVSGDDFEKVNYTNSSGKDIIR